MSNTSISFAFVREGTSDDGLLYHLERLVLRAGAEQARGALRVYAGTSEQKIQAVISEGQGFDLVFVHRDADGRDGSPRHAEVLSALVSLRSPFGGVAVVPVQATEAWLLTSEVEIRRAVGRPSGRTPLTLPQVAQIENAHRPKDVLREACLVASDTTGRRRAKEGRAFALRRRTLLSRLDIDGSVSQLPSWRRLVADTEHAVRIVLEARRRPDC